MNPDIFHEKILQKFATYAYVFGEIRLHSTYGSNASTHFKNIYNILNEKNGVYSKIRKKFINNEEHNKKNRKDMALLGEVGENQTKSIYF